VSVGLRSAISVRILPPVRNVSRTTALARLHSSGRTQRKRLQKKIAYPVSALKVERGGVDGTDPRGGGKSTSSLI